MMNDRELFITGGARGAECTIQDLNPGPTGDVMYDAVLMYYELAENRSKILEELNLKPKAYALATVHRAENTDDPERLKAIFQGLVAIAQQGLPVIVPLHPRTRKALSSLPPTPCPLPLSPSTPSLRLIDPVSYLDMLLLEKNTRVILTDSGGVQNEAFFFRVPCVTLRQETEWVETVEAGWNTLVGCEPDRILQAALDSSPLSLTPVSLTPASGPYGDGRAAERMVEWLWVKMNE